MKRLTFSFFLGLVTSCAYGEYVQLQTASAMPQPRSTQEISLAKEAIMAKIPSATSNTHSQNQANFEAQIGTPDNARRFLRVNGALNTSATLSLTLQRRLEMLRDIVTSIASGIRPLVSQFNKFGLDAHTAEMLESSYEDCFDKLFRFPKNSAKSPYSDCILWIKNVQETLETFNGRLHTLRKILTTLPRTPDIAPIVDSLLTAIDSAIGTLNEIFDITQIPLQILHEFSQKERIHGWHNTPWL